MNDYDIFIKEMIDETIKPDGELSALARKFYEAGYEHCKQQAPKGLPGVTADQVRERLGSLGKEAFESGTSLVEAMTTWFNDPNRDAPAKATMHPDLEWLASLPPERFNVPTTPGDPREPYFYRTTKGSISTLGWGTKCHLRPPLTWSLAEIEQARRHLANPKTVLHPDNDPHIDAYVLGLNKLPDYRLWFDIHGSERTVKYETHGECEASIHGIYTHFRARLLDELRQAGVIGEES